MEKIFSMTVSYNCYLYLKDDELSIGTLSGFPAFVTGDSSLLTYHKLPDVSQYYYIQSNCT